MPYYNVNPHTLYQSCISADWDWSQRDDPMVHARAWVEAENTYEVWKIVQDWFGMIESDEASNRYPDPYWRDEDHPEKTPLTQDVADEFIEEMDQDFMLEKNRFQGRLAPEFSRLPAHARIAFVQEAYKVIKTSVEIKAEAERRVKEGETFPPKAAA